MPSTESCPKEPIYQYLIKQNIPLTCRSDPNIRQEGTCTSVAAAEYDVLIAAHLCKPYVVIAIAGKMQCKAKRVRKILAVLLYVPA